MANSQTKANKNWQEKNRDRTRYLRNRCTARSFIKKQANLDDLAELSQLLIERKELLTQKR